LLRISYAIRFCIKIEDKDERRPEKKGLQMQQDVLYYGLRSRISKQF
jgi:hypothetical protein